MLKTQASKLGLQGLLPHVAKQFYPPPANCVLYLPGFPPGGATIIDHSGQANHGTIVNATWGKNSKGLWILVFDGNDYITCNGVITQLIGTSTGAIEVWAYPTSVTGSRMIFALGNSTDNLPMGWGDFNGATIRGYIRATGGTIKLHSYTGNVLSVNNWYHVCWIQDGISLVILLNGVSQTITHDVSETDATAWFDDFGATTPDRATIGAIYRIALSNYFAGYLPPLLRVYTSAPSIAVFQGHFNQERHLFGV